MSGTRVNAYVRYIDSYVDDEVPTSARAGVVLPTHRRARLTLDAQYTYEPWPPSFAAFSFGASTRPTRIRRASQTSGGYDSKVPDPRGRMLYAKATFKF